MKKSKSKNELKEEKEIKVFRSLHKTIQRRSTGTPRTFAKNLGISLGELNKILSFMRNRLTFKIRYDKIRQTFYYVHDPTTTKDHNTHKPKSK